MEIQPGALVALKINREVVLGVVRCEQPNDSDNWQSDNWGCGKSFLVKLICPHSLQSEEVSVLARDLTPLADTNSRQPVSLEISGCLPEIICALLARIDRLEKKSEESDVYG
jgi:hypothetical protein